MESHVVTAGPVRQRRLCQRSADAPSFPMQSPKPQRDSMMRFCRPLVRGSRMTPPCSRRPGSYGSPRLGDRPHARGGRGLALRAKFAGAAHHDARGRAWRAWARNSARGALCWPGSSGIQNRMAAAISRPRGRCGGVASARRRHAIPTPGRPRVHTTRAGSWQIIPPVGRWARVELGNGGGES